MYSQTFLVTSVRAIFLPPQTAARASESCFGAKIPRPFFFMAKAFFLLAALMLALLVRFFSAVIFFNAALVSVVFFVVTVAVGTVVFVVVVVTVVFVNFTIAIVGETHQESKGRAGTNALLPRRPSPRETESRKSR